MSNSPPEKQDVEQSAQSGGEEQDQSMDRDQDGQGQGVADFDVKEQDRWLPIANGGLPFNMWWHFPRPRPAI